MKWFFALLLCSASAFSSPLYGKEVPWIDTFLECQSGMRYTQTTARFHGASLQNKKTDFFLSCPITTQDQVALDVSFAKTNKKSLNFDSSAFFYTRQLLDDLQGDPVAFSINAGYLFSPKNRVADYASTHYSAQELSLGGSIGKEFGYSKSGFYRWWLAGSGIYTVTGSPVVTGRASFEKVFSPLFACTLFVDVARGFGKDQIPSHFRSWSEVSFQKAEVGATVSYTKKSFFSVELTYKRALFTKLYPASSQTFSLLLSFPFSFL